MPTFRTAVVSRVLERRPGLSRVEVILDEGDPRGDERSPAESRPRTNTARAYAVEQLCGPVVAGDRVIVNTTAVELGLGTGGWHVVHWNLDRAEFVNPGPEHIMKLRYTSLQCDVGAGELEWGAAADGPLGATPVVATGLHSLAGVVLYAARQLAPTARLAYVMTDGAALPYVLSDLMHRFRTQGVVDVSISAGHAFGADVEAVTTASAIGMAVNQFDADIVVVAMGPGVVGTGSQLGTTAIEVAHILDDVRAADGTAVLAPRVSMADSRTRHLGVSHHTVTALRRTGATPLCPDLSDLGVDMSEVAPHVDLVHPRVGSAAEILGEDGAGITSMGRGLQADPLFFEAGVRAAAAAIQASAG